MSPGQERRSRSNAHHRQNGAYRQLLTKAPAAGGVKLRSTSRHAIRNGSPGQRQASQPAITLSNVFTSSLHSHILLPPGTTKHATPRIEQSTESNRAMTAITQSPNANPHGNHMLPAAAEAAALVSLRMRAWRIDAGFVSVTVARNSAAAPSCTTGCRCT